MNTEKKLPITLSGAFFYCSLHLFGTHFAEFFLDMRCRSGRVRRLHNSGDDRNACDRTFRQHIHVVRIQSADRDDGIGTARQTSFSTETGVTLVVTCVVVGKIAPRTEVVSAVLIGRLCRLDRFCRRADDLVRAEQFSADRDRADRSLRRERLRHRTQSQRLHGRQ